MSTTTSNRAGASAPPNRRTSCRYAWITNAAITAAAWAGVIAADAANLEDLRQCLLVIAGVLTGVLVLTGQQRLMLRQLGDVNERIDRQYADMARLVASRPGDRAPTPPPWPRLPDDSWQLPGGVVPFPPCTLPGPRASAGADPA